MSLQQPFGYLLGQTTRVFKGLLMTKFKENNIDLSLDQFVVLVSLSKDEHITQQELADHLMKDKSSIMRHINLLVDRRYMVRLPDLTDKRKKNLVLTKKGFDILELAKFIGDEVTTELLMDISISDLQVFESVLNKILLNGGLETDSVFCR